MTETSRITTAHQPGLAELRQRYERTSATGPAVITHGLALLAGLWLAISPWVTHFNTTAPDVTINNLILGIAVAALTLAAIQVPQSVARLSWTAATIGVWIVVSQWVIQQSASSAGIVWNNMISGGVIILLGVAAPAIAMTGSRTPSGARR
ncbi:SPW repeat protein [Krasilnikovia sp. M28-CT-15]